MRVGDLIKETEWPEIGLIVKINLNRHSEPYAILCPDGKIQWFSTDFIENKCEVINGTAITNR